MTHRAVRLDLEYPFLAARQLRKILAREGHPNAGRLHISALMAKMGITGLYRKPNTSKRHRAPKMYP
jgi:putative transposase